MKSETKLTLIKVIHTLIWIFFNFVIFYMLYAALINKLDLWLWIGYGFVLLEGLTLLTFKSHCPLNLLARKYTNSTKDNFDIYLPSSLAKYTKLIYTTIFGLICIITIYQILNQQIEGTDMWMKWMAIIVVLIIVSIGIATIYGGYRWQSDTNKLRAKLVSGQQIIQPKIYDQKEIEGLPAPVQRFFKTVLKDGQAIVAAVKLSQQGQFNMSETEDKWSPFTATQFVITQRPGFDWDARIQMAPGLNAFVHDTYLLGEGHLHASLLGLFTVADVRGTPEAAQGELLRFFAETAWYPTALLPSQGVRWEAIDDTSARATLTDGATTVSLVFQFNAEGAIATMRAEARYRDKLTAMPWSGRFGEYSVRNGMLIPLEGEVGWEYPEGTQLYFKGRITEINYEFVL